MDTVFLYLLRTEIVVLLIFPIVAGLVSRRKGLNLRRIMTIWGALTSAFFFTYYVSLGNPQRLSDIPIGDWFVAGLIGLFTLGFVSAFARLL